jgi:hypothetical protein
MPIGYATRQVRLRLACRVTISSHCQEMALTYSNWAPHSKPKPACSRPALARSNHYRHSRANRGNSKPHRRHSSFLCSTASRGSSNPGLGRNNYCGPRLESSKAWPSPPAQTEHRPRPRRPRAPRQPQEPSKSSASGISLTRFRIGSCFRARTVFVEAGSPWVQGTQINTTRRNGGREVIAVRQPAPAAAWCQSQRLLKLRHRPAAADVQASQNPTPAIGRWPAWRVVDRSSTAVWGRLALRASPAWPKTMSSTRSSSSGHIGAWFSAPLWAVPSERTRSTDQ